MLTLTEELLLLAIHDEKGTIIFASTGSIPYGLGATLLLDLAEKKAIELIDNQINLIEKPINTPNFLNLAFEILNLRSQSMSFKDAILELGINYNKIKDEILNNLVLNGILKRQSQKIMFLIKFSKYPTLDPAEELKTRDQIHKAVLMSVKPNDRLHTLICLVEVCNLIEEVFPKNQRAMAKKNIKIMMQDENYSNIVREIVMEVSTMVANSVIVTTIIT